MSSNKVRRENIYNKFSNNLKFVNQHPNIKFTPNISYGFVCPLCWKLFSKDALSSNHPQQLTFEHIPPESLGGKVLTLTCAPCNKVSGTLLDSELGRRIDIESLFEGIEGSNLRAYFTINKDVRLKGILEFRKSKEFRLLFNSHTYHNPILQQIFKNGIMPDIDVNFKGYNKRSSEIAILRIAYLYAFSLLGYGFLCNNRIHEVRYQIINPEQNLLPHFGIFQDKFPDEILGLNCVNEPEDLNAFFVVFDLQTSIKKIRLGVLLPGHIEKIKSNKILLNKAFTLNSFPFKVTPIKKLEYLEDRKLSQILL